MNRQKYNSKGWLNFGSNKTVKSLEMLFMVTPLIHPSVLVMKSRQEIRWLLWLPWRWSTWSRLLRTAKWRECHTGSATSFRKARNLSTLKRSSQKTDHMSPITWHTRRRNRKNLDHSITEKVEIWGMVWNRINAQVFAKLCRQWASWFTYRWQN